MTRCFSFRGKEASVLVPVDIDDRQARKLKARAHEVRQMDGRAKGARKSSSVFDLADRPTIAQAYTVTRHAEEPKLVHVLYASAYTMRHADQLKLITLAREKGEAAMYKSKGRCHRAIDQVFATYMPDFCVDKRLRMSIDTLALARVAPKDLDPWDNVGSALKPALDAICAWIVDGPMYDRQRIGDYDGRVLRSNKTPQNPVEYIPAEQETRPRKGRERGLYGVRIELHQRIE